MRHRPRSLADITACLTEARAGEIVVLPEACLSGYDDDLSGLDRIDPGALADAVETMAGLAADQPPDQPCRRESAFRHRLQRRQPAPALPEHDHLAVRRDPRRPAREPASGPADRHRHRGHLRLVPPASGGPTCSACGTRPRRVPRRLPARPRYALPPRPRQALPPWPGQALPWPGQALPARSVPLPPGRQSPRQAAAPQAARRPRS